MGDVVFKAPPLSYLSVNAPVENTVILSRHRPSSTLLQVLTLNFIKTNIELDDGKVNTNWKKYPTFTVKCVELKYIITWKKQKQ